MSEAITTALGEVTTIFTQATTMITGNPVAMVFVAFALVGAGVGLFRKIVHVR